jgi:hypothetical protein
MKLGWHAPQDRASLLPRLAIASCCAALGLHAVACAAGDAAPQRTAPRILDDARLQQVVEDARSRFLARQPFDRFDVTVLIAHATRSAAGLSEAWLRGSVGGDTLAYPASCVKLPYLVAAVHWCQEQQRAPDCLDADVRPMIRVSDNVATGRVIDAITGTTNLAQGTEAEFSAWFERRRYPERVLESQSLLGSQRLFTKTYPTNSGEEPAGFEARAWQQHGRNAMSPDLAARLMLAIVSGRLEPQATAYMRELLRRERFSTDSGFGAGLPPGTTSENKIGSAFDTLEDISYAELPGGGRLVIAGFSNGWNPQDPPPGDVHRLGDFTVELLRGARAAGLLPPAPIPGIEFEARVAQVVSGEWRMPEPELPGARALQSSRLGTAALTRPPALAWDLHAPTDGRYELLAWYPAVPEATAHATYRVTHAAGESTVTLDQRIWTARWVKLGDFDLRRGQGRVVVTAEDAGTLAADTLALSAWPAQPDPAVAARIEAISRRYLGVRYQLDPLGEGPGAPIDPDPLLRYDRFDCQTYVETVLALARSAAPQDLLPELAAWRYRGGQVEFGARNHFPDADWIPNNIARGALVELTDRVAGNYPVLEARARITRGAWLRSLAHNPTQARNIQLRTSHAARGRLAELARSATDTEASVRYLPREALADAAVLARIPSGAIVFIVRPATSMFGRVGSVQNISHLGFAIREGERLLYRHASSGRARAVVDESLATYLARMAKSRSFAGIAVYGVRSL